MNILNKALTFSVILTFVGCATGPHNDVTENSQRQPAQAVTPDTAVKLFGQNQAIHGRAVTHPVPSGGSEICLMLNRFPEAAGAIYSDKDAKEEQRLCSLDFYQDGSLGICPKEDSTSAGTMILKMKKTPGMTTAQWESTYCGSKGAQKKGTAKNLAKFKNTMNEGGEEATSGTYSIASLLYYHFSRFFNMDVVVPAAVFRTFNREEHLRLVTEHGNPDAEHVGNGRSMLSHAWHHMYEIETDPSSDPVNARAMLLPDATKPGGFGDVFGVLLKKKGESRAGPELNGDREGGWGIPQSRDLLTTVGFGALQARTSPDAGNPSASLDQAIQIGIAAAKHDPHDTAGIMPRALGSAPIQPFQAVSWMKDAIEISVLDFIFNQQDRVGNIDMDWEGFYFGPKMDEMCNPISGASERLNHIDIKVSGIGDYPMLEMSKVRAAALRTCLRKYPNFYLVERAHLNDNDAGGLAIYSNFTNHANLLTSLHHFNEHLYKQVMILGKDFAAKGPIYQYVNRTFAPDPRTMNDMASNVASLMKILKNQCPSMIFDVEPKKYLESLADASGHPFQIPDTKEVCTAD